MNSIFRRLLLLCFCLLGLAMFQPAHAQGGCPAFPVTIPAGDIAALKQAITCANSAPTDDVINLTNSTYTFTQVDNVDFLGDGSALPAILSNGTLTINGNGATLRRSSAPGTPDFRLLYIDEIEANVTLSNVTLSNGKLPQDANGFGGGILNFGTLAINDSTFTQNRARIGGGIANEGTLIINNSTFTDNHTTVGGGGIANYAVLEVNDSVFSDNISQLEANNLGGGGGIANSTGDLTINRTTFSDNVATAGGGIYSVEGSLIINSSTFSENDASYLAGGVANQGTMEINDTVFVGNSALNNDPDRNLAGGGGLYHFGGLGTIRRSSFANNSTGSVGGAIGNDSAAFLTISNTTIYNNTSEDSAGGIMNYGTLAITNNTLSGNSAPQGGGLANLGTMTMSNNIIANSPNGNDCFNDPEQIVLGSNNIIEINTPCGNFITGTINADPKLGTPITAPNGTLFLPLLPGSPALNAGDNSAVNGITTDQTGNTRIRESVVDIGAYESVPADLFDVNDDGNITPADGVYVINRIGQQPVTDTEADIDGDDDIDENDANLVIAAIGR